nr:hypothetical protein [uncultured Duganella sp.]
MSLPDLALQIVYGRLAWALVAAAVVLALAPALLPALWPAGRARRTTALATAGAVLLMALPGAASPAYWLILVFQYPSALLVGFSVVSLGARWRGRPSTFVMPAGLALPLVAVGLLLYVEAFGMLALGLYAGGFGTVAAPLLACAAAVGAAVAIARGQAAGPAAALLIAVLLFSLLRLPTGNLWDGLLDPLLWSWALGSAAVAVVRQRAARRAGQLAPQPASDAGDLEDHVLAHAANE